MIRIVVVVLFYCTSQVSGWMFWTSYNNCQPNSETVQCDLGLALGCIGGDCDRDTASVIEYTATNGSRRVVVASIASNLCRSDGAAGVVTINGESKPTVDLNNVGQGVTYRLDRGDTIRVTGVQYMADQNINCITAGSLDFGICEKV